MKWFGHRIRKLIVGVFIGVYSVVDTFFPVVGRFFVSEPVTKILTMVLGVTGEAMVFGFIDWRSD